MPTRIIVRPFDIADEDAVVALWERTFPDDPPWNEPRVMIRRKLTVQPELFLIAETNQSSDAARGSTADAARLVGTVLAGFDGVRGWIHHLAVDDRERRAGIGTKLMREAECGLAGIGCPKVNLQVRATNAEVIAFYRALGYALEDRASLGLRLGE